jgi:hypothetical protein
MDDRQPCSQRDTTSAMRGSDRMFVAELCRQRAHLSQSTRHAEVNERPSPSGQSSASAPAMWSSSWVPTATVAHQVISPTSGDGESDQARTESSMPAISSPPHRESGGAKAVRRPRSRCYGRSRTRTSHPHSRFVPRRRRFHTAGIIAFGRISFSLREGGDAPCMRSPREDESLK